MKKSNLRGLYAITDCGSLKIDELVKQVEQAINGHANLVQYRNKKATFKRKKQEALALKSLCASRDIPLIINDDISLAKAIQSDGVHLGRHDASISEARHSLGKHCIIGKSCYNSLNLALEAEHDGADYIAFGRFYSSTSKPEATPATIKTLAQARQFLTCPLVAIGGINAHNGAPLISAGADMLAVIGGIFHQPDIQAASQQIATLFSGDPS